MKRLGASYRATTAAWLALVAYLLTPCCFSSAAGEQSFAGQLLVATDEMRDPRFSETVIYIVKDNSEGTLGLVINRPLAKGSLEDLLKGFGADGSGAKGEIV